MPNHSGVSFKHKLTFSVVGTAALVLTLTCSALLYHSYISAKSGIVNHITALGKVIADQSGKMLSAGDKLYVTDLLASLRSIPEVRSAVVLDSSGQSFASYGAAKDGKAQKVLEAGSSFLSGNLVVTERISFDGKEIGWMYLEANTDSLWDGFYIQAGVAATVLTLMLLVAFTFSLILQHLFVTPLLELAGAAEHLARTEDYSLRVPRLATDEISVIADAINLMLEEIERRDISLQRRRERLEEEELVCSARPPAPKGKMDGYNRSAYQAPTSQEEGPIIELTEPWEPESHQPSVLVVEDNLAYQNLTRKILERNGYAVQVANNGAEALQLLEGGKYFQGAIPFDVIVMDIQMPVMDGIEAASYIRTREQETGLRVPIVALTALSEEKERCLSAGLDDFVAKPLNPKKFMDVISRISGK